MLQDKDMGIQILVVAVGNWLNELEIRSMASYPAENNVFQVRNFDSIGDIESTLREAICNGIDNRESHFVITKLQISNEGRQI